MAVTMPATLVARAQSINTRKEVPSKLWLFHKASNVTAAILFAKKILSC
jgi:hypothetical protein